MYTANTINTIKTYLKEYQFYLEKAAVAKFIYRGPEKARLIAALSYPH